MSQDITESKIILRDLLVTYYHVKGEKPHPPLLFLHGWRSNSTLWFKLFPELIKLGCPIYALDFPGFGKSQVPPNALTLQDYVEVVKEFMEKLELEKVILVGHSHGGRVGIKLAFEKPQLLQKLVLVDSSGIARESTSKSLKKGIAKIIKPVFKPSFMQPLRTKIYQSMGAEDYVATPELQQTFLNIINQDLTPILSKISTKTLLIWGENDKDTPIEDAKLLNESISHSELKTIKNAGHYSFLDNSEAFLEALIPFITNS